MYKMKKTLTVGLLVLIFLLSGCGQKGNVTDSLPSGSTVADTPAESSTKETTTLAPKELKYSAGTDGKTLVTGVLSNGVIVSAEVLSSRDLHLPGEASTYQIQAIHYSEQDRARFASEGWTLTGERTEQINTGEDYFSGTGYYDTYSNGDGGSFSIMTLPENTNFDTPRGALFYGLATSIGDIPEGGADFSFASMKDAYLQASSFLSKAGFRVSDCYDVYRIPYTWLEQSEKLTAYYGDDTTAYKQLYPEGLTSADNAYLFYLQQSIDDLPILTGGIGTLLQNGERPAAGTEEKVFSWSGMQMLVTDQGIEYAQVNPAIEVGSVVETKNLCSFETALKAVTDEIYSGNMNDDIYLFIGSRTTNTITVEKAELGYLPVLSGDEYLGKAIPCWIFQLVWEDTDSTSTIKVKTKVWAAVNAYTGEHIPATATSLGEA